MRTGIHVAVKALNGRRLEQPMGATHFEQPIRGVHGQSGKVRLMRADARNLEVQQRFFASAALNDERKVVSPISRCPRDLRRAY